VLPIRCQKYSSSKSRRLAGDKVGALLPRGIENVLACFAVARLGGIMAQISPASKAAEVAQLEEKLNLDWLLHDCEYERLVSPGGGYASKRIEALPFSARIQRSGQQTTPVAEREQLLKLNAAAIGFSSGTTSESKAIILSHDALIARGRMETNVFRSAPAIALIKSLRTIFAGPCI
jgi:long-chain acyl-CoA synthetase